MKGLSASLVISLLNSIQIISATQPCPEGEFLSKDGKCYPKIFIPTNDFKTVVDGQTVLGGKKLDIRFGMGEEKVKQVKLLDPSEAKSDSTIPSIHPSSALSLVENSETDASQKSSSDPDFKGRQEALNSHSANFSGHIKDHDDFHKFINQIESNPDSTNLVDEALIILQEMVMETENAERLLTFNKTLKILVGYLEPKWPAYRRSRVATLLGTALQNNPKVQKDAHRLNLIGSLLPAVSTEVDQEALSHLIFTISACVRGDIMVLKSFHEAKGLKILLDVYKKHISKSVDNKILTLIADVNNADLQPTIIKDSKTEEVDQDISFAGHDASLLKDVKNWCNIIQENFIQHSKEKIESEIFALAKLVHIYPSACQPDKNLESSLKTALLTIGNSEYFDEYRNNINEVSLWAKNHS